MTLSFMVSNLSLKHSYFVVFNFGVEDWEEISDYFTVGEHVHICGHVHFYKSCFNPQIIFFFFGFFLSSH